MRSIFIRYEALWRGKPWLADHFDVMGADGWPAFLAQTEKIGESETHRKIGRWRSHVLVKIRISRPLEATELSYQDWIKIWMHSKGKRINVTIERCSSFPLPFPWLSPPFPRPPPSPPPTPAPPVIPLKITRKEEERDLKFQKISWAMLTLGGQDHVGVNPFANHFRPTDIKGDGGKGAGEENGR